MAGAEGGGKSGLLILIAIIICGCSPRLPPGWTPDQKPVCEQGMASKVLWTSGGVLLAVAGTAGPIIHALAICDSECSNEQDGKIVFTWSAASIVGAAIVGAGFAIDDRETITCLDSRKAHRAYLRGEPIEDPRESSCEELQSRYCRATNFETRGRYFAQLERRGCWKRKGPGASSGFLCGTSCEELRWFHDNATDPETKGHYLAHRERLGCIKQPPPTPKQPQALSCKQWRERIQAARGNERIEIARAAPSKCAAPPRSARCREWDARIKKAADGQARLDVIRAAPRECIRSAPVE